jgi:hypothetical protein
MMSKEQLLQEAKALRDLARQARLVMKMSSHDQEKMLGSKADYFDERAGVLESEAAQAKA